MKQDLSNREIIMSCAQRLFFEKGYDRVGVQEIVDAAGITKPTMYYYFKSKQGLLECLLDEGAKKLFSSLERVVQSDGDYETLLERVTDEYLKLAVENSEFYIMFLSLFFSARDNDAFLVVKPYISRMIDIMRKFFERFSQTHSGLAGCEYTYAVSYTGSIHTFMLVAQERGNLKSVQIREEYVRHIVELYKGV